MQQLTLDSLPAFQIGQSVTVDWGGPELGIIEEYSPESHRPHGYRGRLYTVRLIRNGRPYIAIVYRENDIKLR